MSSKPVDLCYSAAPTSVQGVAATSASQFVPASAPGRHPTDASMRSPDPKLRIDKSTSQAVHTVIRGQCTDNKFHLVGTLNEAETQSAFSEMGVPSLGKLVLGIGFSAKVRLAYYIEPASGERIWVAVKKIDDIDVAQAEIAQHQRVQQALTGNAYVVELIDHAITLGKNGESKAYLFMQWMNPGAQVMKKGGHGDLDGLMNHADFFHFFTDSHSPVDAIKKIAWHSVSAVNGFHQVGLVHRDIKPENVYCDRLGNVKLGDYASVGCTGDSAFTTKGWTPMYVPHDILLELGDQSVDEVTLNWSAQDADRFALGCTLLELRNYLLQGNEKILQVDIPKEPSVAIKIKPVTRKGNAFDCWVGSSIDPKVIPGETLDQVIALLMYNKPGGRTLAEILQCPYFNSCQPAPYQTAPISGSQAEGIADYPQGIVDHLQGNISDDSCSIM